MVVEVIGRIGLHHGAHGGEGGGDLGTLQADWSTKQVVTADIQVMAVFDMKKLNSINIKLVVDNLHLPDILQADGAWDCVVDIRLYHGELVYIVGRDDEVVQESLVQEH